MIDIYIAAPEREDLAADLALLSRDEIARADRFVGDGLRRTWVAAHALLRRSLSRHAPVAPAAWRFVPETHGKPAVAAPAGIALQHNLTHAERLVGCVISTGPEVGIDLEDTARHIPYEVMPRVFSAVEREAIERTPLAARADRFLFHWTMKEAYLKATGLGLIDDLPLLAFHPGEPVRASFAPSWDDDPAAWQLESRVIEGHRVAIAIRHAGAPIALRVHPPAR